MSTASSWEWPVSYSYTIRKKIGKEIITMEVILMMGAVRMGARKNRKKTLLPQQTANLKTVIQPR